MPVSLLARTPRRSPSSPNPFPRIVSACTLLAGLFVASPFATANEAATSPVSLRGKLDVRNVTLDGERVREPILAVGKRVYVLDGDADVLETLVSWRRKWVDLSEIEVPEAGDADEARVTIASIEHCAKQEPVALEGVVTATVTDAKKRSVTYALVKGDRRYAVQGSSDIRKIKAYEGKNVVVKAHVADDGTNGAIEAVAEIARKLLPGEREPSNQKEAIAGSWKGVLDVQELPSVSGGAREGKYPAAVTVDDDGESASGKLFGQYSVERVRLRKFRAKTRALEFDIEYTLPNGGTYTVMLDGAFAADWKSIEGSWTSSFLGKGVFRLDYVDSGKR